MKIFILVYAFFMTISLSLQAGAPAQENAFVDKYKTAFEAKDTPTLESFLYTQDAEPAMVAFAKRMLSSQVGAKISKIELVHLTPEEAKAAAAPVVSPVGSKVCLSLKPTRKLVVAIEKKDANGSSTEQHFENFIAEKDGRFIILIPGPCK